MVKRSLAADLFRTLFIFAVFIAVIAVCYWGTLHMLHSWFDVQGQLARATSLVITICGGTPLIGVWQQVVAEERR